MRPIPAALRARIVALGLLPISVIAWLLVRVLKPRAAYWGAAAFVGAVYPLIGWADRRLHRHSLPRDRRSLILRAMLGVMTRHGRVDPAVRLGNFELVERTYAEAGRLMLCTAHFGLTMAVFSVLERRGYAFNVVTSGHGKGWNWGCDRPLDRVKADEQCLRRLRASLAQGTIAVVYADAVPAHGTIGGDVEISPSLFRFARLTKTPILYFDARRLADGAIGIDFFQPEAADAEEFCRFVAERTGWRCAIGNPPRGGSARERLLAAREAVAS
jgi:hypothetical protein